MKSRSVVAVMSAALIGATAPGFAQAAPGDGHRDSRPAHSHERHDRDGIAPGVALAVGLGILGLVLAADRDEPPAAYAPGYGPGYGYAPGYAPQYVPPAYGPRYDSRFDSRFDSGYAPRHRRDRRDDYAEVASRRSGVPPGMTVNPQGYLVPEVNPMTGY